MKVIRKINTSAAVALDSAGKEVIILGKGVGFPEMPYDLTDLSRVERTFYDIDPRYRDMIGSLRTEILLASAEIAEEAEIQLNAQLNPQPAADAGGSFAVRAGAHQQGHRDRHAAGL